MEIRKEGYAHSVESVAKNALHNNFNPDLAKFGLYPWSEEGFTTLHLALTTTPKLDEFSFSKSVVNQFSQALQSHTFRDAVTWTIAGAIIMEDETLKVNGLDPVYRRFMLDLALGVTADDYHRFSENYLLEHSYNNKNASYPVLSNPTVYESRAKWLQTLQLQLRQPAPIGAAIS